MSSTAKLLAGVGLIAASFFFPGLAPWALAAIRIGGSILISAASKPKLSAPTSFSGGAEVSLSGDPIGVREVLYGQKWVGGTLRFRQANGDNNENLYMVIVLAGHEIDSVTSVVADKQTLTLDGAGDVTVPSKWNGRMNVRFYTGTDSQTADAALIAAFPGGEWTSNHRLRGLAYAIVKLTFDETNLNTIPEFRFLVKGRKVYSARLDSTNGGSGPQRLNDPSTWGWSENVVDCCSDFARGVKINSKNIAGGWLADSRFDWANVIAEANVCDESVSLDAGGTQKRYTANVLLDPRQTPSDLKRHFELAMAGDFILSDTKWRFFAGAYRAPTLSLDDSMFIGPLQHEVWQDELSRLDTATGTFASQEQLGSAIAYTPFSLDGADPAAPRMFSLDLQAVNDLTDADGIYDGGARCQRIAKLELEKQAAGKKITVTTSLYGLRCVPGETVQLTHAAFGLSAQTMRVLDVQLRFEQVDGGVSPLVDLTLEAGPSDLYSWSAEETAIAAPPSIPQLTATELPPGAWTMAQSGIGRVGSTYFKVSGVDGAWDAGFSSVEGFEGCFVAWSFGTTDQGAAVGLSGEVPAVINTGFWNTFPMWNAAFWTADFWVEGASIADYSFENLDFGILAYIDGHVLIEEAGVQVADLGTFVAGETRFKILYDGQKVEYFKDEASVRTVRLSGAALHLNSSFLNRQSFVQGLGFGPVGLGLAVVDELRENFAYRSPEEFRRRWLVERGGAYPDAVSFFTGADTAGGTGIQIGNDSGDDELWAALNVVIPYDAASDEPSLYEVGVIVRQLYGTGGFYCGVEGLAADGKTLINNFGANDFESQHYFAIGAGPVGAEWTTFRGYFKGFSTSPVTANTNDSSQPGQMYSGVAFVRPMFLANYSGTHGRVQIGSIWLRRLSSALGAKDQVNTPEIVDDAVNVAFQWSSTTGVGYSNIA